MSSTPYPVPPSYGSAPPVYVQFENPVSKIELKVSCRNLVDLDVFSKSDPFVVLYLKGQHEWLEVDRTETIIDNLNPDFVKSFILDYFFEEQQMIKFEVYDSDGDALDLSKQDFIGQLVTSLGSIVGENGGKLEHHLQTPTAKDTESIVKYKRKSPGTIIVRTEEVNTCRDYVTLHLCGQKLDKKDFFGKSDPFLVFERCNEDNSYSTVHKTEVIKKTLNPTWQPFTVPSQVLCNGDMDRTIRVSCYDWDSDGGHDLIGSFDVTLRDFVDYRNGRASNYWLINSKKKQKKSSYKNSGTIHILNCIIEKKATFLDYIRGGMELAFVVAVDFTASNGDPMTPQSFHYNGCRSKPSQYVQALRSVGAIIEDYDTDKLFPAFGFGARLPPTFSVSHEFAMNFNPMNPNCQGIDGIIAAYYNSVQNVQLYGPTNFSPVINSTARLARSSAEQSNGSQYFVLLIITDGIISDMEKTKAAIVYAATLPMSIIIVGVGPADFHAMEELDGDTVRVSYQGKEAERDIVQFVSFQDYMSNNIYNPASGVQLAKDVLHELPEQVLEYMEKHSVKADRPPTYS